VRKKIRSAYEAQAKTYEELLEVRRRRRRRRVEPNGM